MLLFCAPTVKLIKNRSGAKELQIWNRENFIIRTIKSGIGSGYNLRQKSTKILIFIQLLCKLNVNISRILPEPVCQICQNRINIGFNFKKTLNSS
jgi:hypothetical protein